MAINKIKSGSIEDNAITSAKVADGVISAADVADGTLTDAKLNSTLDLSSKTITLPNTSVTNDMLAGSIANAKLANPSITLNGSAVSLGGSATVGVSSEPYFIAGNNTPQNLTNGVSTGINLQTEDVDSDGCFNNTGSATTLNGISVDPYSFAPNVAGYYVLGASVHFQTVADGTSLEMMIMKNQGAAIRNMIHSANSSKDVNPHCSLLIYANGSTDDFQLQVRLDGANDNTYYNSNYVRFWGYRVA